MVMNLLNKKIINFGDKFFGLDLSDISLKVLQLEKEGNSFKIRNFASEKIPEGIIENGSIIKKDQLATIIKKSLTKVNPKKINTRKVVCSLPESKAFLRIISIPKMKKEEAGEAVKWEIEASIPLSIDQVYFDWQFIGEENEEGDETKNKKQSVLTVAVSKEIVDQLMEVFKEAKLDVYALELESISTVRSLINQKTASKETSLIIDLGAKRTSFIIVEKGIPYFTSSIPFSSENLTDVIAKYLNVNQEEAEKIKLNRGISQTEADPQIFKAVEPLLNNLVMEIEKTIDFYMSMGKDNSEIKRIILCGGGANLSGLLPYLVKKLSKDIEEGDPWTNLNLGNNLPPISKKNASSYATVVGLAMREIDYAD